MENWMKMSSRSPSSFNNPDCRAITIWHVPITNVMNKVIVLTIQFVNELQFGGSSSSWFSFCSRWNRDNYWIVVHPRAVFVDLVCEFFKSNDITGCPFKQETLDVMFWYPMQFVLWAISVLQCVFIQLLDPFCSLKDPLVNFSGSFTSC